MEATVLCLLAAVALAAFPRAAHADFQLQRGGLKIEFPSKSRETFDMTLANFGHPVYGGRLTGKAVYLANGYLDEDYECPSGCEFACEDLSDAKPPFKIDKSLEGQIMLVDRGPYNNTLIPACRFVDKVWHAQQAGAVAVVVVNYEEQLVTPETPRDQDSPEFVKNITIPSGFVGASVGNTLKKLLKDKEDLVLVMDWVDVLPKKKKVKWELWTNSNDNCGNNCDLQRRFIQDFALYSQKLEEADYAEFSPHYLIYTCRRDPGLEEQCDAMCIRKGRYCVPDPEADLDSGYDGRDIMLENLRQMCLYDISMEDGKPEMWWKYSAAFWDACGVTKKKYGVSCSEKVFRQIGGPSLMNGNGLSRWRKCIDQKNIDKDEPIPLLEAEQERMQNSNDSYSVSIVPTILINGHPYRGTLRAPSVMRAICSSFSAETEPAVCVSEWVSDDECKEGQMGHTTCNNSTNTEEGKTKCKNTFSGFECGCLEGFLEVADQKGRSQCVDINECLSTELISKYDDCTCERCACHNLEGTFSCEDRIINQCEEENGGCWEGTIEGKRYTACVDKIDEYKEMAAAGKMDPPPPLHECICPPCFKPTSEGGCEPKCDLDECERTGGDCPLTLLAQETVKTSKGGISVGLLAAIIVFLAIVVAAIGFLGYRRLRGQMHNELDYIMTHYMPLNEDKPGNTGASAPSQDDDVIRVTQVQGGAS